MKSNVRGRKKEKLDPNIIDYVTEKCFYYFPTEVDDEEEWVKCIKNIDKKLRIVKNKRDKQRS